MIEVFNTLPFWANGLMACGILFIICMIIGIIWYIMDCINEKIREKNEAKKIAAERYNSVLLMLNSLQGQINEIKDQIQYINMSE